MKIVLVRHGQTLGNSEGRLIGRNLDMGLTPLGEKQSEWLGVHLNNLKVNILRTSPLLRARQTANILKRYISFEFENVDDALMERDFGAFEGLDKESLRCSKVQRGITEGDLSNYFPSFISEVENSGSVHRRIKNRVIFDNMTYGMKYYTNTLVNRRSCMKCARAVNMVMPGDKIGLFSPSEPLTKSRINRMKDSIKLIESNYQIVFGGNAFKKQYNQAGTREERVKDIVELASDDNVKALLATWGGKNGSQLLKLLPYKLLSDRRIPVIGFSDTCVLLNPITVYSNIVTFYGPNIAGKMQESQHSNMSELQGGSYPPFGNTTSTKWTTIVDGCAEGILYGGNLSTFSIALAGSDCLKKMDNVIFFWESAADSPQLIDQYLTGLENAGFFERVSGMIVGEVLYDEAGWKDRPINDLLEEYGNRYNIPVIQIRTFGHCATENPMIPIGASVKIDSYSKKIELTSPIIRQTFEIAQ